MYGTAANTTDTELYQQKNNLFPLLTTSYVEWCMIVAFWTKKCSSSFSSYFAGSTLFFYIRLPRDMSCVVLVPLNCICTTTKKKKCIYQKSCVLCTTLTALHYSTHSFTVKAHRLASELPFCFCYCYATKKGAPKKKHPWFCAFLHHAYTKLQYVNGLAGGFRCWGARVAHRACP